MMNMLLPLLCFMPMVMALIAYIAGRKSKTLRAIIVGGNGAVGKSAEGRLASVGIKTVVRKAGANAIETSMAIAQMAVEEGMHANYMGVATTNGYWDALTGGPLCGLRGGVLVLASQKNVSATALPRALSSSIVHAYVLGGRGALDDGVFNAFAATTANKPKVNSALQL